VAARQRICRTAKNSRTATRRTHGNDGSHGKAAAARQRNARTEKPFAGHVGQAHGNVVFAVGDYAVQTLPCVDARQSLCRAK
jgi:hypothetical protein